MAAQDQVQVECESRGSQVMVRLCCTENGDCAKKKNKKAQKYHSDFFLKKKENKCGGNIEGIITSTLEGNPGILPRGGDI